MCEGGVFLERRRAGTVPIYAGGGALGFNQPDKRQRLNRRLPHPDAIVYVGDFHGVADLGAFLAQRIRNDTLYRHTHFSWRAALLRERIELVTRRHHARDRNLRHALARTAVASPTRAANTDPGLPESAVAHDHTCSGEPITPEYRALIAVALNRYNIGFDQHKARDIQTAGEYAWETSACRICAAGASFGLCVLCCLNSGVSACLGSVTSVCAGELSSIIFSWLCCVFPARVQSITCGSSINIGGVAPAAFPRGFFQVLLPTIECAICR